MAEQLLEKTAREAAASARRTRTLYVREEDQPIWDKARELISETSLSTYLTEHLRTLVASREASARGFERIILSFRQNGIPKTKAFYGRWLISPDKPFETHDPHDGSPDFYAVALTPKDNVVVFNFYEQSDNGKYGWGRLLVFDSFHKANEMQGIPSGLVAEAMEVLGVQVEELDI